MESDKLINILKAVLEKDNTFFPCFLLAGIKLLINKTHFSDKSVLEIFKLIFNYGFVANELQNPFIKEAITLLESLSSQSNTSCSPCTSGRLSVQTSKLPNVLEEANQGQSSGRLSVQTPKLPTVHAESDQNKCKKSVTTNITSLESVCVESNPGVICISSDDDDFEKIVQTGCGKFINIISKQTKHYKNFKMDGIKLMFQLKESSFEEINNLLEWLESAFDEMLKEIFLNSKKGSRVNLSISLPNMPEVKPIWVSLRPVEELNGKLIVNLISDINQSNSIFFSDEIMVVEANVINFPYVGAKFNNTDDETVYLKNKRSIKDVSKRGFFCLPKCIAYALEMRKKVSITENKLLKIAGVLCKDANVTIVENKGCILQDLFKFQKFLKTFQIVVFNTLKADVIFQGPPQFELTKKIYLYFSESQNHFYVVKSPTGFFNKKYLCIFCDQLYDHKYYHKCEMQCRFCFISPPCVFSPDFKSCQNCNRSFRGEDCYNYHLTNLVSTDNVCNTIQVCKLCGTYIDFSKRNEKHVCGEFFCTNCFKYVPSDHLCYMKLYKKKIKTSFFLIFFDCESTQNVCYKEKPDSFIHTVNLIIAQQCCDKCSLTDILNDTAKCEKCGDREHIFKYKDNEKNVVQKFIDYCYKHRPFANQVICVAHNLQGYDGHFIISELLKRKLKVDPVMNGSKIMKITCGNVIFIDSLNFLPFSLSKLPKIFGIQNVTKGFYPHFFNTTANWNYVGKYPSTEMYGVNTLKTEARKEFLMWYNLQSDKIFNNQVELVNYCKNDVKILRESCVIFMQDFLKMFQINPFIEALTIASTVMLVYRKNFLKEDLLGIMPNGGYTCKTNQSLIAIKWLIFENKKVGGKIKHVENCGEVKLPKCNIRVDGYNPETETVYEFFGCYFHGCVTCFQNRAPKTMKIGTLDQRYESTCKRIELIKKNGYKLVTMWECQFKKFLKENLDISSSLNNDVQNIVLPLNPRDAVFGGRTEIFAVYYKVKENEKIQYLDFTSLYPYVNKYAPYPVGHPNIFKKNNIPSLENVLKMHGFIMCKILPPQNINIPVLPFKINKKLYFPLCRSCCEFNNINVCSHNENDRSLIGTWILSEVTLAVKQGYKIIEIYEIWEYNVTQYNPETQEGGLFSEYVNNFLKLKQEASGWPTWCTTNEEKEQYIKLYEKHENITLNKSNIKKNSGRRHEAKLCLNSLWGKFGQREDKAQTMVINSFKDLSELFECPNIIVSSMYVINDQTLWVNWKYDEENQNSVKHINIPVAGYTTSYARMKLFEVLLKVSDRVLYCDTDSIIFIEKEGQNTFKTSEFLGGLTNELESYGPDAYITEFVSIGPKSYGLEIKTQGNYEYVTKCKGITMNFGNSHLINFKQMKNMVLEDTDPVEIKNKHKIKRKQPGTVVTEPETKRIRFTFNKRIIKEGFSYPYGFKNQKSL